ncbi:hypothetical protein GCM10028778_19630 [Barrientosiimonas marina]|uniref:DUF420 domain-containing protein n=1 Tax=Lentibacillus kimchii TaxID=1542911 RepID=A0ABW2UTG5_9BACI
MTASSDQIVEKCLCERIGGLTIFLVVIIILLLVISLLIKESALYNKWVKMAVALYYTLITIVFITGRHRIHEKYNMYDGPVIPEGWDVNSNWAFWFSFAFIIPIGILVLYAIIRKIKPLEKNRWTQFTIAVLLSGIILFFLYIIFNLAYGLRP